MARSKNLKLNNSEFAKLRTSAKVVADLERRGRNVAAAAGGGMKVTISKGGTRARVTVTASSPTARRREAKERALTKSIDAARR